MRITDGIQSYQNITRISDNDGVVTRKPRVENAAQAEASVREKKQSYEISDIKIGESKTETSSQKQPTKTEVVDYAVNKSLKADKDLIGRDSSLENLDVQKAISNMKKDSLLREYQVFVRNPESEDGTVRKYLRTS